MTLEYARPTGTLHLVAEYLGDATHPSANSDVTSVTIVHGIGGPYIFNASPPVNGSGFNFEVGLGDRAVQREYSIYIDGQLWGTQIVEGRNHIPVAHIRPNSSGVVT